MEFSLQSLLQFSGPGVYIFWGTSGRPVYIGATAHGFGRCFSSTHKMIAVAKAGGIESLSFEPFDSAEEAFKVEELMIREFYPKYNADDRYCRRRMKQRTLEPKPALPTFDLALAQAEMRKRWRIGP